MQRYRKIIKRSQDINITNFETLLTVAQQQLEPQRLLFVFLKASLPKDHETDEATRFNAGNGGALQPVMCVDKPINELTTFEALAKESEETGEDWQMVLVACMSGNGGIMPNSDEAAQPLKMMMQTVQNGGDLSTFMTFDRKGDPVSFE